MPPAPVYQQLNDQLRTSLGENYRRGDKFLTEREISQRFSVSRATANKALASLVSEGWLEFRRGIGTFVLRQRIDYDVRSLVSFTEKAKAAGKTPSTLVIDFQSVPADRAGELVCQALTIASDEPLWQLHRVRLADGQAVIDERRYVVARFCPNLTADQVHGSLYEAWTVDCGLAVAGADEIIRAVPCDVAVAGRLNVSVGSPLIEVIAVGYVAADPAPLWWERTLYRGDCYEFHSRLGPIRHATPARGRLRP